MDVFNPLNLFGNSKTAEEPETVKEEVQEEAAEPEQVQEAAEPEQAQEAAEPEQAQEAAEPEQAQEATEPEQAQEATEPEAAEEPVAEAEPQWEKLDKIMESQQQLSESIAALNTLFNARIMHTDHEEKIVDQMHKELQKYKEDMYSQLVRPILLDIIEVRDSIMRIAATYLAKPEGEQAIPNKTFADYSYDLQDILEKNSVEIYRSNPGDDFVPLKQRVLKKVATADESLHGKVAESLSCGYSYNGRTISAEKITVYFYEKPVEENENSEVIENG